jgi:hypothetical protein
MTKDDETSTVHPTIIDLDPDQVVEEGATGHSTAKPVADAKKSPVRFLSWSIAALTAAAIGGGWFYRDVLSVYLPSDQLTSAQTSVARLEADNKLLHDDVARVAKLTDTLTNSFDALESKTAASVTSAEAATTATHDNETRISALDAGLNETKKAIADLSGRIGATAPASSGAVDGSARCHRELMRWKKI